jgi:hypothetical protein
MSGSTRDLTASTPKLGMPSILGRQRCQAIVDNRRAAPSPIHHYPATAWIAPPVDTPT